MGRRRKPSAFWESVELYRLIVESARDFAIFTVGAENKITSWSRGAERILGYSEGDAIGRSAAEIFVPEDRKKNEPEKEIQTARRKGRAEDERWHLRKGGKRFWGSGLMMPLRDDERQIVGYLKILRDLTERKAAQDALLDLNRTLEERVRERTAELEESYRAFADLARQLTRTERMERERIASDLHDNVGQMLAIAQMKVAGISSCVAAPEEIAGAAREVREYLDQAVIYTRGLMSNLSPPGLGRGELVAALKWLAGDMRKHGLKVTFRDDGKAKRVSADVRAVIFQAVRELLFNVRKHSRVDKAAVRVSKRADVVRVEVVDEGIGFGKRRRTRAVKETCGFGLTAVAERLKLFGGELSIDRGRKRGAKVTVCAPVETSGP